MINKLQQLLKGKTKLNLHQNISNYDDEMNYKGQSGYSQFEEDPFAKNAPGIRKIMHEVLLLIEFLQTKPQIESMNIN